MGPGESPVRAPALRLCSCSCAFFNHNHSAFTLPVGVGHAAKRDTLLPREQHPPSYFLKGSGRLSNWDSLTCRYVMGEVRTGVRQPLSSRVVTGITVSLQPED